MTSVGTFDKTLPIVATMLCSKFGVTVRIGGDEAFTNGQLIQLPSLFGSPVSEKALVGFLVHECGHVRFSEFFNTARWTKLKAGLVNILEDGRIERLMQETFPGARYYLSEIERKVASGTLPNMLGSRDLTPSDEPLRIVLESVFLWARIDMAGFGGFFSPRWPAAEASLAGVFGADFLAKFRAQLEKASQARSTADIKAAAEGILKLLRRAEKNEAGGKNAAGAGDEPGRRADSPSAPGGAEASCGKSGADQACGGEAASIPWSGRPSSGSAAGTVLSASADEIRRLVEQLSPHDRTKAVLNEAAGYNSSEPYIRSAVDLSVMSPSSSDGSAMAEKLAGLPPNMPLDVAGEADKIVPLLRRRIRAALEAQDRVKRFRSERGGRITTSGLVRFASGDARAFERREEGKAVSTAVHILIDFSGSMRGEREFGAKVAALALLRTLSDIPGVSLGISSFSSGRGEDELVRPILKQGQNRIRPRVAAAERLLAWEFAAGGTPMEEGILCAGFALAKEAGSSRKILCILTDGVFEREIARSYRRKLRASGIETRALVIDGEAPGFDVDKTVPGSASAEVIADALIEMTADGIAQ